MAEDDKLGKNIRSLRIRNNLTVTELADKSGVSRFVINDLEHDKGNPTRETLKKIAKVLNVSTGALEVGTYETTVTSSPQNESFDRLLKLLDEKEKVGVIIRRERVLQNMSQQDLADAIGMSRDHINRVENGKATITPEFLHKATEALGYSTVDFLSLVDNEGSNTTFVKRLKETIRKAKITLPELAYKSELELSTLKGILSGNVRPTHEQLEGISGALNVPIVDLIGARYPNEEQFERANSEGSDASIANALKALEAAVKNGFSKMEELLNEQKKKR